MLENIYKGGLLMNKIKKISLFLVFVFSVGLLTGTKTQVEATPTQAVQQNDISNVKINTNDSNNQVTIQGNIASGIGKNVTLEVLDPKNSIDYIGQTTSVENGGFTFKYTENSILKGNYIVKIGGEGITNTYETSFALQTAEPTKPTATITSINAIDDISVVRGANLTLPTTVTAKYSDGTTKQVAVQWNDTVDTNQLGTKTITGTVAGYNGQVTVNVTVRHKKDNSSGSYSGGSSSSGTSSVSITTTALTTADTKAIIQAINNSAVSNVSVAINSQKSTIDSSVFDILKGSSKIVTFNNISSDGTVISTWSFDGKTINKTADNLDLTVKFTSPKQEEIKTVAKTKNAFLVFFNYHGDLPGTAKISVKVDNDWLKGKDKNDLSLYYYNSDTKSLELVAEHLKVDDNGYVTFSINHCSDYVILDKTQAEIVNKDALENATKLVEEALREQTFYKYNTAYYEVTKLVAGNNKEELLNKLASISSIVWTGDIKEINKVIDEIVATASGKIYDQVQVEINNANISDIDKAYLLGEVTSWGKKLVWTSDYADAVDKLNSAWISVDEYTINRAEAVINQIKNQYSKDYLIAELSKVKEMFKADGK
jgi:hypothetical protein